MIKLKREIILIIDKLFLSIYSLILHYNNFTNIFLS